MLTPALTLTQHLQIRFLPQLVNSSLLQFSVVTVIETDTETAVFWQNRTEPKPRFYAFD